MTAAYDFTALSYEAMNNCVHVRHREALKASARMYWHSWVFATDNLYNLYFFAAPNAEELNKPNGERYCWSSDIGWYRHIHSCTLEQLKAVHPIAAAQVQNYVEGDFFQTHDESLMHFKGGLATAYFDENSQEWSY